MDWGRSARYHWSLNPDGVFLNHGSYGAVPKIIAQAMNDWRQRADDNPDYYFRELYPAALEKSRTALGTFLSYEAAGLALVENATSGIQAIIQSLIASEQIKPGDLVVTTNHVYGAVRLMLRHLCRQIGADYQEICLPVSPADQDAILTPINSVLKKKPALLVIDHIASPTALVLPIAALCNAARHHGVPVLVDGAHGPGMVDLDLSTLAADFYVGNGHKWLGSGRGCGFIAAAPAWRSGLKPLVISHDIEKNFPASFGWVGTREAAAWLTLPDTISLRCQWPLIDCQTHGHNLLDHAANFFTPVTPSWGRGLMGCYDLGIKNASMEQAEQLWQTLRHSHRIEAAIIPFEGRILLRLSAFIYNEKSDIDRLGAVLPELVKKVLS
jgi:isopenicillin-N epimerase